MDKLGVLVYYSAIPCGEYDVSVYPREREDEILSIRNDRLRKEKYFAWRLLEEAVTDLGFDFSGLKFAKTKSGKWVCDKLFFSISHTVGAVAVAISASSVGVDIEKLGDRALKIAEKVFSADELDPCASFSSEEKKLYTTRLWTKKESIFKTLDERVFSPQAIVISDHVTSTLCVELDGKEYIVSVAGEGAEAAKFVKK